MGFGGEQSVDDHVLNRLGCFVIVDHLVHFEARGTYFVDQIRVFDVVADLIVVHSSRVDESK